jgi:Uma2 family endonuclease
MTALKHKYLPHYTYDDYVNWEGKWELIYGIPYSMAPAPGMHHQEINLNIATILKSLLADCNKCKAYLPIEYKFADDAVLQPDALVVCEPFEKGAFLSKTPEIVFEILSPSTRKKDLTTKYDIYESLGVKYYVIVDPVEKMATVYTLVDKKYSLAINTAQESFDFEIETCQFSFDFGKIW